MNWFNIGAVEIARIVELEEPFLPPEKMFVEATADAIAPYLHWLQPRAMCPESGKLILPIQTFVVRTRHHVALVDTCVGCHKSPAGFKRWAGRTDQAWLARLAAAGVQPGDVDFVFCTHLHLDHCGWHTRLVDGRWVPTFPRARYLFSREEYAYAERRQREQADPVFAENVLPVMEAGLGQLVAPDHVIDETLRLESTPGHTPGHVAVHIGQGPHDAVVTGDLIHSPLQCVHPEWNFVFDEIPSQAGATRRQFLEKYADSSTAILASHFPSPSVGRIETAGAAFRFRDVDA